MARSEQRPPKDAFEESIRRALKTPPISNEEIERRSKEKHRLEKRK